jgi:hypothetical protein
LLEHADELASAALARLIGDKCAHIVRHPYPYDLEALHDVMAPLCSTAAVVPPRSEALHFATGLTPARLG